MAFGLRTEQETLSAATNVGRSTRVRVLNSSSSTILMTLRDSDTNVIGSVTLGANQAIEIWKNPSDTLEGGADLLATGVTTGG